MARVDFQRGEFGEIFAYSRRQGSAGPNLATEISDLYEQMIGAHRGREVEQLLTYANQLADTHGVEGIENPGRRGHAIAEYLNAGDTYALTLLYDVAEHAFILTSYGDWLEAWERDHVEGGNDPIWRPDPATHIATLRAEEGTKVAVHYFQPFPDDEARLAFSIPFIGKRDDFSDGDHVFVRAKKSKYGEGLSYPETNGFVQEDGSAGGLDVFDVQTTKSTDPISVYGTSIEPSPAFSADSPGTPWTWPFDIIGERGNFHLRHEQINPIHLDRDQWNRLRVALDAFYENGMKFQPVEKFLVAPR